MAGPYPGFVKANYRVSFIAGTSEVPITSLTLKLSLVHLVNITNAGGAPGTILYYSLRSNPASGTPIYWLSRERVIPGEVKPIPMMLPLSVGLQGICYGSATGLQVTIEAYDET